MSKVLLLNGSPHVHGCAATALEEMIKVFEEEGVERCVCDYVSGMTDRYAIDIFKEIYVPGVWSTPSNI